MGRVNEKSSSSKGEEVGMKKTLILTVGLPRSGKSTWAKKKGFPIVNPDSVRLALHGQAFVSEAEEMVWTISHYMVRALFLSGHDFVIVDATNTTRARREKWKSPDWRRVYQVFHTDQQTCIQRAIAGDQTDLVPVIERMFANFEPVEEYEFEE